MTPPPLIGFVIDSNRETRFGDKHIAWISDIARQRKDMAIELVEMRDHALPFFDAPQQSRTLSATERALQSWSDTLEALDGLIVVTTEFDIGAGDELQRAFNNCAAELRRKPIGFVGYGGSGEAIERMRLMSIKLQMAPVAAAVHIGIAEYVGIWRYGKSFQDYPHLAQAANALLDDIVWWANALKKTREAQ